MINPNLFDSCTTFIFEKIAEKKCMFLNAKMTVWEKISDFHNYDESINIDFWNNHWFHIKNLNNLIEILVVIILEKY